MQRVTTNTGKTNKSDVVVSRTGDFPSVDHLDTEHYGTFIPPLMSRCNALDLVLLKEQEKYKNRWDMSYKLVSPAISVDYFCSECFV